MKRGTTDHPKTKTFARTLGVPLPMAIGILQLLWEFASDYALDGGVGKFTDDHIAEACGWVESPGVLVTALCDQRCQWLDPSESHRLVVHDWADHCEDSVHNKLARAKRFFADGSVPKFSRLSKAERAEAEKYYRENPNQTVRGAQNMRMNQAHEPSARGVQIPAHETSAPTMPCHAMPVPCHATPAASEEIAEEPPPTTEEIKAQLKRLALPGILKTPPTKEDFPDDNIRRYMLAKDCLLRYPGVDRLTAKLDDDIIKQCLEIAGNDLEALQAVLHAMYRAGKAPTLSWAFFPAVLKHHVGTETLRRRA